MLLSQTWQLARTSWEDRNQMHLHFLPGLSPIAREVNWCIHAHGVTPSCSLENFRTCDLNTPAKVCFCLTASRERGKPGKIEIWRGRSLALVVSRGDAGYVLLNVNLSCLRSLVWKDKVCIHVLPFLEMLGHVWPSGLHQCRQARVFCCLWGSSSISGGDCTAEDSGI